MKKVIILVLLVSVSLLSNAQKFGYIDSEYITSKMPAYKEAAEAMDQYSKKWIDDIAKKTEEITSSKLKFQQEEILLTEEMKKERLNEIDKKEKELSKLNNEVFGLNGLLFQKKKDIMRPILDEVYKACEKVSRQKRLSFMFDKASDISMIYTDPRHDYTDYVLEAMGIDLTKQTNN